MRIGIVVSHPIQYYSPLFRVLAQQADVHVFYAMLGSAREQAAAGFGVEFEWDVDLLGGYRHTVLRNIARPPGSNRFGGCDTPEIADKIREGQFDSVVVFGWNLKSYWQATRACRNLRIPVLVRGDSQLQTSRPNWKRTFKRILYPIALRQFDGYLAVGTRNREYLVHYGAPADRIFSSPHFVDNAWFSAQANAARARVEQLRRRWGATDHGVVVLFVGKLIPKKRPVDLLNALSIFGEQDVCVVFVGAGELEPELRELARAGNLPVHFEGFRNQTELPAYYAAADVLVLPSDGGETWGLVVNEAMACGVPAIVSHAVGCAPDMIDEGRTGFTFPLGDVEALVDRMERVVRLKRSGFDFAAALREKLTHYSVEAAAEGVLCAARTLTFETCAER